MSVMAVTRTYTLPRGATVLERVSIRFAVALAGWATARAEHRHLRRDAMLAAIQREQTRNADPRAADHLLAQVGLSRR